MKIPSSWILSLGLGMLAGVIISLIVRLITPGYLDVAVVQTTTMVGGALAITGAILTPGDEQ